MDSTNSTNEEGGIVQADT